MVNKIGVLIALFVVDCPHDMCKYNYFNLCVYEKITRGKVFKMITRGGTAECLNFEPKNEIPPSTT